MCDKDAKAFIHRLSASDELPMELLDEMMNAPSPASQADDEPSGAVSNDSLQQPPAPPSHALTATTSTSTSTSHDHSPTLSSDSTASSMSTEDIGNIVIDTNSTSNTAMGSRSAPGTPSGGSRKKTARSLFAQVRAEGAGTTLDGSEEFGNGYLGGHSHSGSVSSAPSSPRGWLRGLGRGPGAGGNLMTELESELSDFLERLSLRQGLGGLVNAEQRRLKELIGKFKVGSPVSEKLKATREKLKDNILEKQYKLEAELDVRAARFRAQFQKPPFVRLVDKITFTVSVIAMLTTLGLMLKAPAWIPAWYTMWTFGLMAARFVMYHQLNFHYFMLDFCYFHQALLLFYLHLYPSSSFLFELVFALSHGPIAVAIPVWRNSLVFHDLDKVTSLFIHALPPVVTYTLRWEGNTATHQVCEPGPLDGCAPVSVTRMLIIGLVAYGFWQLSYYFKTEHVDKVKLKSNPSIQTSFRWMSSRPGRISSLILGLGETISLWAFMYYQGVFVVLSLLPVAWWFNSQILNTGFLASMIAVSIWNGANFYFEVFAKSYVKRYSAATKAVSAENAAKAAETKAPTGTGQSKDESVPSTKQGDDDDENLVSVSPSIAVDTNTGLKRVVRRQSMT